MQPRHDSAKAGTALACVAVLRLAGSASLAQPGVVQQVDNDVAAIIAESDPRDDQVLPVAPKQIDLQFPRQVRLVKLALYNEMRDWVDIGFRYNPRPESHFVWPVPLLEPAAYYTAHWAILGDNQMLQRGTFSFSFGPGAERPSDIRERDATLIEIRNNLPLLQELERLGLDPAEIIINNQNQPVFEPPFAPILD